MFILETMFMNSVYVLKSGRPNSTHIHAMDIFYIPIVYMCLSIHKTPMCTHSCAGRQIQIHPGTHEHGQTRSSSFQVKILIILNHLILRLKPLTIYEKE